MSWYTFLSGVIYGMFLLSGVFSLVLSIRGIERRINLPYFFFSLMIGAAIAHGLFTVFAEQLGSMLLHERLVNTFMILGGIAFVYMVSGLTGYEAKRLRIALVSGLLLLLVLNWVLPYGLTWGTMEGISRQRLLWGEEVMWFDARTGIGNLASIVIMLGLLVFVVRAMLYQMKHGDRTMSRWMMLILLIGSSGVLTDVVLLEIHGTLLGVIDDVGFFAFVLLIGHRNFNNLLRSNELIRRSEQRFALLTEAAFEGIGFSEQARIIDVNRQLADMLGYEPEELIGRSAMEFVAPPSRDMVEEQIRSGNELPYEHLAMRKDGSVFPVEVRVKHIVDGERTMRVSVIRDVTEHKRAEEQNLLLARTLKSVRDCVSITDSEDRIIFVNDAFTYTYGYSEQEILGKHVSVLRSPNAPADLTQGIFPSTRDGGWHGEVLNRRKDGSEFSVELWTSVVRDGSGEPVAYVGVARDISERKYAESAIIAEKERAERSERLKDAFIANISHEVRTPLNIILGYTGLIGEILSEETSEEVQGYFDSVQRGAQRLQRTVDMILSISRLQVGDILIEPKRLRLDHLLADILEDYRAAARRKSLALSFINDTGGEVTVSADEYCTIQTVQNLIDNAIKYTEEGSVTLRLAADGEGATVIEVRDTGIGISEEYLPLIFEPYTQEESGYSRSYEGIGLGLSLVKRYVELIGATLHISSEKSRGTTVSVRFSPRAEEEVPAVAHDPARGTVERSSVGDRPSELPTVLLVEDELLTVEYMTMLLRRQANVISAASGNEAWDILDTVKVNLILMDISLSGDVSGLELTRQIRATEHLADIPIIAVTAHAFAHDRTRCLEAGCDAYLLKPVEQQTLLDAMNELLDTR